ncbi:MAG: hypothetical protein IMX02_06880 [Limnochordaceae bacterium]|nr:hypothetical protein [Limnochordaceae bacterium]
MAPYRLPGEWDERADLIVRYEARAHVLRVTPESPEERDEERIRAEDRRLCDFVVSQLRRGCSSLLDELLLQAYAQLPGFGTYPGSPADEAVSRDPRIRLIGGVARAASSGVAATPASCSATGRSRWRMTWPCSPGSTG